MMQASRLSSAPGPIGVFDSGYGGLTILDKIREQLPQYNYIYLGDNARTPYGTRSFEVVYQFTLQAVKKLFELGCPLVILACNTASAKALRSIQQIDLPHLAPANRVLGVIRPTVEAIGEITRSRHVGVLATAGTILSRISPELRQKIEEADLLLAKGQGNFESMYGCGKNVYYLFLCKCDWFIKKFRAERLQGMFVNEHRI